MTRKGCFMPTFCFALLATLPSTNYYCVNSQDITPRSTGASLTRPDFDYLDLSSFDDVGTVFYDWDEISVQLIPKGHIWQFHNTKKTSTYFHGLTRDTMASLSLMRYTSETTGMSVMVGRVHDRATDTFYDIKPDYNLDDTVSFMQADELPPFGEPPEKNSWLHRMTNINFTEVTRTLPKRVSNLVFGAEARTFVTVDVLVLWTLSSECYKSGIDSTTCTPTPETTTNMEAAVTLMMEETNTALSNSNTEALLKLVHMQRDSSGYRETWMSNTLNQITRRDGTMDYILSLRNDKKADLVQFIVDNRIDGDKLGGIAWLPQKNIFGCYDSSLGYSCICAQCMNSYVSAHEFGHNLGCVHDRGTAQRCTRCGGGDTNFGYRAKSGKFRTIMAYQCRTDQCDNIPTNSCPWVPYFSGPGEYDGESRGGEENNCAGEIAMRKNDVAVYR